MKIVAHVYITAAEFHVVEVATVAIVATSNAAVVRPSYIVVAVFDYDVGFGLLMETVETLVVVVIFVTAVIVVQKDAGLAALSDCAASAEVAFFFGRKDISLNLERILSVVAFYVVSLLNEHNSCDLHLCQWFVWSILRLGNRSRAKFISSSSFMYL